MVGVTFSGEQKVEMAKMMDEAGIHRIDVGIPALSNDDANALRILSRENLRARLMCLTRAKRQDIDLASDAGAGGVVIEIPASYHIQKVLGIKHDDAIDRVVDSIIYAKAMGLFVAVLPWDSTRADLDYFMRLAKRADSEGHADSVALVDTFGAALPDTIFSLVRKLRSAIRCQMEIHCHNDFGLATANTLAGVAAGCNVVHSSFNGLGERCGDASTEEVALAVRVFYDLDMNLKMERFRSISKALEQISGSRVPTQKPVVGENASTYESGLVANMLDKAKSIGEDELVLTPYKTEIVGNSGLKLVLGRKSGKASIRWKLEKLGVSATPELVDQLLSTVRNVSFNSRRILTDDEFQQIVRKQLE